MSVSIDHDQKAGGGKLVIKYNDLEGLDDLIRKLNAASGRSRQKLPQDSVQNRSVRSRRFQNVFVPLQQAKLFQ
jgi:hypothetical protein